MNGTLLTLLIIGHVATGILATGYYRADVVNAISAAYKNENKSVYEWWLKRTSSSKNILSINQVSILLIIFGYFSLIVAIIIYFSLPKEKDGIGQSLFIRSQKLYGKNHNTLIKNSLRERMNNE